MTNSRKIISFALFMFPLMTFAQSFTAQTERTSLNIDDKFELRLELQDLSTKDSPDFSELEKHFQIVGQRQSSVMKVINGKSSSSTIWDLTLVPTQTGPQEIPSITINSNAGEIKTAAIQLQVKSGMSITSHETARSGFTLIGRASNPSPYKYERIRVTYEMVMNQPVQNIDVSNLEIKDAIVDRQGDPKVQTRVVNGRVKNTLVASYFVTPLKDGDLMIPPLVVHGVTQDLQKRDPTRFSSDFLGDDRSGAFAQMHKLMQNFMHEDELFGDFSPMRPITVASSSIPLKIIPPVPGVIPWLPISNLKLSESWSGEAKVGEPISRTIITQATGIAPSQLPGFENQIGTNQNFKVYADQPVFSENKLGGAAMSSRKDVLTIIPSKTGDLRFPALKVAWWDTVNHKQQLSFLPEKVIQVLPGTLPVGVSAINTIAPQHSQLNSTITPPQQLDPGNSGNHWVVWSLLAVIICLAGYLVFLVYRPRKSRSNIEDVITLLTVHKSDLNSCSDVHEIQQFLQKYSQFRWGTLPQTSLSKIFSIAESKIEQFDKPMATELLKSMESGLYAQTQTDVQELRKKIANIFFKNDRVTFKNGPKGILPELNPS